MNYKNCKIKSLQDNKISGTSLAMSSGFFNDLRVAKQEGWDLTSFITVHK